MIIVGLLKDIVTIVVGILSSYKVWLEIKKLKNSKEKPRSHRKKKK